MLKRRSGGGRIPGRTSISIIGSSGSTGTSGSIGSTGTSGSNSNTNESYDRCFGRGAGLTQLRKVNSIHNEGCKASRVYCIVTE